MWDLLFVFGSCSKFWTVWIRFQRDYCIRIGRKSVISSVANHSTHSAINKPCRRIELTVSCSTLFSKRSAHENHPNFLRSLGHRPRPQIILNGVFCILLSRPFDKIDMTLGQGQLPRVTGRTGVNQCPLLLEKSVSTCGKSLSTWIFRDTLHMNNNNFCLFYNALLWCMWNWSCLCEDNGCRCWIPINMNTLYFSYSLLMATLKSTTSLY